MSFPDINFQTGTVITSTWLNAVNDACQTVTNVKDFGAVGDGITDDWQAIKRAVDSINITGGELYFPPGTYYTAYKNHAVESNWIAITKSGVSFVAEPGSVILQNFLFYAHGSYGTMHTIGATDITTGDTVVTTATAHGLVVGDYFQLVSQFNTYTSDAGVWQNGSQNPTTLLTPDCRMSEIHQVGIVNSSTSVTINDTIYYGTYKNTTAGLSYPMTGVTGAQIRKLIPIEGLTFKGITFKNITTSSFRSILIRCAVNTTFDACKFIASSLAGIHVKTTECLKLSFLNCFSQRTLTTFSGSSWNSFVIGGGSQDVLFDGCSFYGEAQTIDFTPGLHTSDIGYNPDIVTEYATCQKITITNCKMFGCSDGFTTHPSTYNLVATNNLVDGGITGMRIRSLNSVVTGNFIKTISSGISFSSFYENAIVSGNNFEQTYDATNTIGWIGVSLTCLGSETMNNNTLQNVVISNNTFKVTQSISGNCGVQWRNYDNGTPANPSFTLFTSTIKNNQSNHTIKNNNFYGCSIVCYRYFNYMNICDNFFTNGSDNDYYINLDATNAYMKVWGNYFNDTTAGSIQILNADSTCRVGLNYGRTGLTNNITSALGLSINSPYCTFTDLRVSNGAGPNAHRTSGTATLYVDAIADDDTSNEYVSFHTRSSSTGQKYTTMPSLSIKDGITAPTVPTGGFATIYVDTADGDLKIKFSDNTVKTIVTD